MRRTLLGLAAVTLTLSAVPALADDAAEPVLLAACPAVEGADAVTLQGLETTVAAPLTPSPTLAAAGSLPRTTPDTERRFVLDLAGAPTGSTGAVPAELTWSQSVNDYDLFLAAGEQRVASQEVNPTGSAREATALSGLQHCDVFTVRVHNYAAVPETLDLALAPAVEEPEEG